MPYAITEWPGPGARVDVLWRSSPARGDAVDRWAQRALDPARRRFARLGMRHPGRLAAAAVDLRAEALKRPLFDVVKAASGEIALGAPRRIGTAPIKTLRADAGSQSIRFVPDAPDVHESPWAKRNGVPEWAFEIADAMTMRALVNHPIRELILESLPPGRSRIALFAPMAGILSQGTDGGRWKAGSRPFASPEHPFATVDLGRSLAGRAEGDALLLRGDRIGQDIVAADVDLEGFALQTAALIAAVPAGEVIRQATAALDAFQQICRPLLGGQPPREVLKAAWDAARSRDVAEAIEQARRRLGA